MTAMWIVVADSGIARIFEAEKPGGQWKEMVDMTHPESRLSGQQLDSAPPGRSHDSMGQGRHSMEPQQNRKEKESGLFAREVAAYLKQNHIQFDHLYLLCAPRFLGLLRKQLDPSCTGKVIQAFSVDVVHEKVDRLRALLVEKLSA
jgi:protein required for attachment to host cells